MSIPNNKYRIRFRRIVEGEIVMDAVSLPEAQKLFSIELACGNVPCMKAENEFILSLPICIKN